MPNDAVQVRPATHADAPEIARLMRGLGFEHSSTEITRRLSTTSNRLSDPALVAVLGSDDRPCGLVALHIARLLFYPQPVARITTLVVDEDRRRRGIGRLLVNAAATLAEEAGCDTLELTTGLSRTEAHAFYQSLGFESTSFRMARRIEARSSVSPSS